MAIAHIAMLIMVAPYRATVGRSCGMARGPSRLPADSVHATPVGARHSTGKCGLIGSIVAWDASAPSQVHVNYWHARLGLMHTKR
jgi:hypothetical protein